MTVATPVPSRRTLRLSTLAAWGIGLLLLATWALALLLLAHKRDEALLAEQRHNHNLAHVLQAQTVRVLASADQALRRVGEALRTGSSPDLARLAQETGLGADILAQLALVGPDGHFVASNLDPDGRQTGPIDLSEREHVQAVLRPGSAGTDTIFIGKPVLGKVSQRWTVQLSRRLSAADGRTLGVAVASLDPAHFENLYRGVALGRLGGVALVGADSRVRAGVVGGQRQGMGSDLPASHPLVSSGWPASGWGVEANEGDSDATDAHIVAFERVGDYPLYVVVSTASAEAFADWHGLRNRLLFGGTLGTLVALLLSSVFLRRLRAQERAREPAPDTVPEPNEG